MRSIMLKVLRGNDSPVWAHTSEAGNAIFVETGSPLARWFDAQIGTVFSSAGTPFVCALSGDGIPVDKSPEFPHPWRMKIADLPVGARAFLDDQGGGRFLRALVVGDGHQVLVREPGKPLRVWSADLPCARLRSPELPKDQALEISPHGLAYTRRADGEPMLLGKLAEWCKPLGEVTPDANGHYAVRVAANDWRRIEFP